MADNFCGKAEKFNGSTIFCRDFAEATKLTNDARQFSYPPGIETMLSDVDEIPAIQLGDNVQLRFELEPPDEFSLEVAERELRETPERKASAIEELRTLLKGEHGGNHHPHLRKSFVSHPIEIHWRLTTTSCWPGSLLFFRQPTTT